MQNDNLAKLTPRERQVLVLLSAGKTSKEIALELRISARTVDVHRSHLRQKLRVRSVAELVRLAMRT